MSYWPAGVKYRPIASWTGPRTGRRKNSPFRVGIAATEAELDTEIRLGGLRNLVLQVALTEADLRIDGTPRARATVADPGVILSFERADGTALSMPCDAFATWEENLLAIVRTINMLRAVDRYGVTTHGEQYAGWKAIEAPGGRRPFDTGAEADAWLRTTFTGEDDDANPTRTLRIAQRRSHPDAGGDSAQFRLVTEAEQFMRRDGLI